MSVPKLLPTVPVHVQALVALLVHFAVAVAPTFRQVIEAEAWPAATAARVMTTGFIMITTNIQNQNYYASQFI